MWKILGKPIAADNQTTDHLAGFLFSSMDKVHIENFYLQLSQCQNILSDWHLHSWYSLVFSTPMESTFRVLMMRWLGVRDQIFEMKIFGVFQNRISDSMVTQTDQCTYWKDIIHVSNFVAVDEMCYLPAWHLAVDFQFTLVAPLFLLACYYSAKMGTSLAVIASLAGSGFTIYFFLKNNILHSAFTGDHM